VEDQPKSGRVPTGNPGAIWIAQFDESELANFVAFVMTARDNDQCPAALRALPLEKTEAFAKALHTGMMVGIPSLATAGTGALRLKKIKADIVMMTRLETALSDAIDSGVFSPNSQILNDARLDAEVGNVYSDNPTNPYEIHQFFYRIEKWTEDNDSPLVRLHSEVLRALRHSENAFKANYPETASRGIDTTKGYGLAGVLASNWKSFTGDFPPINRVWAEDKSFQFVLDEIVNERLILPLARKYGIENSTDFWISLDALNQAIGDQIKLDAELKEIRQL
jgi:hypothetical protein